MSDVARPGFLSRVAARVMGAYRVLKGEGDLPFGWRLLDTTTVTLGGKIEIPPTPEQLFDAYANDLWTHACVSAKARAIAAAPLVLKRRTDDGKGEVVAEHPILDLLERPSPTDTWETYCATLVMHMSLSDTGSAFVEKVRRGGKNKGESPVAELRPLLPTKMRVRINPKTGPEAYLYKPNERELDMSPDDVMHLRFVDPRSEVKGVGPIRAAWQSIMVGREAQRWNQSFFARGAFPGVTLQTNAPVPPAERDRLKAEWNASHQGTGKAHGVAVLPYGLTAAEFGLTHKDMQYRDLLKMVREDAHAVWSVPPILTGLLEYSSFATASVQLAIFRDHVVLPILRYIAAVHGWDLFLEFEGGEDLYLEPDLVSMRLPDEEDREMQRAVQLMQAGIIDRNEARALVGYADAKVAPLPVAPSTPEPKPAPEEGTPEEREAVAEGRESAKSMRGAWHSRLGAIARDVGAETREAVVALADPPVRRAEYEGAGGNGATNERRTVAKESETAPASDDEDDGDGGVARISTPWQLAKAQRRTVSRLEPKLARLFEDRLARQKAAVLKLVRRKFAKAEDEDEDETPAARVDLSEEELVRAVSEPLSRGVMDALAEGLDDGGKQMAEVMRVGFLEPEKWTQDYLDDRRTNLEKVLDEDTASMVRASLRAAYDAGETERQVIERLSEGGAFAASRAQRIARTELHAATQGGAFAQMRAQGVKSRSWLAAPDDLTRPSHVTMSGQSRGIDEPFETEDGIELNYPGDPDGPPEEVINCLLPGTRVMGTFILATRSSYAGDAIEIITRSGRKLSVTANHPVLTSLGFVAAQDLKQGDHLVGYMGSMENASNLLVGNSEASRTNEDDLPPMIEEVFHAALARGASVFRTSRREDFHGDGKRIQGDVEIVAINGLLWGDGESTSTKLHNEFGFMSSDMRTANFSGHCRADSDSSFDLRVHGLYKACTFGLSPEMYSEFIEAFRNRVSGNIEFPSKIVERCSGQIFCNDSAPISMFQEGSISDRIWDYDSTFSEGALDGCLAASILSTEGAKRIPSPVGVDDVIHVRKFFFRGHVYDLQSPDGIIIANGLTVRNCRCVTTIDIPESTAEELSDLLDALGVGGEAEGAEGQVAEAAESIGDVLARVRPDDVAPLSVARGDGREVEYELAEKPKGRGKLTVGPKAPKADVADGLTEHVLASVTTSADARGFVNGLSLQKLPDVPRDSDAWSTSERKRTVALVSRAATDDRSGLESLVGQKLDDAEWRRYQTLARNFWIGIGTQGPKAERR